MFEKFSFKVFSLFTSEEVPEVHSLENKSFDDLREFLLNPKLKQFTTLIIGKVEDIRSFAKDEFESLVNVVNDDGNVPMVLSKNELFYLSDLRLA